MAGSLEDHALETLAIARENQGALLAIVGPTASGKTDLAIEVASRVGGEIVSVDSVQIYRGFDIGSGKSSARERERIPQHMIDVVDPLDAMDAGRFAAMADAAIADIVARGKVPILCGGTFLWMKALLFGLAEAPVANAEIRARHAEHAESRGRASLHEELARVDPMAAARLHPNDLVRVSRALEVFEITGTPIDAWHASHAFKTERHRAVLVARTLSSDELTERITQRADAWLASGWLDEVRSLVARGYESSRAMASVGYREVRAHVRGEMPESDLATAIVRATRVFARRQRTWLRSADVRWLG